MQNSKCRIISVKELSCFALFEISCYICGAIARYADILESVFRSPYKRMWKFSRERTKRIALISCIYAIGVSYADVLLYTGVGHSVVYSLKGHSTTFL